MAIGLLWETKTRSGLQKALQLYEECAAGYRGHPEFGQLHADTLMVLGSLASLRHETGDVNGAFFLWEEVCSGWSQSVGLGHIRTQAALAQAHQVRRELRELHQLAVPEPEPEPELEPEPEVLQLDHKLQQHQLQDQQQQLQHRQREREQQQGELHQEEEQQLAVPEPQPEPKPAPDRTEVEEDALVTEVVSELVDEMLGRVATSEEGQT